jgi:hypothetical protein
LAILKRVIIDEQRSQTMTHDREDGGIRREIRFLRRYCLGLTVVVAVATLAGAAEKLVDLTCNSLTVRDKTGAATIELRPDGEAHIRNKLVVGDIDVGEKLGQELLMENAWVVVSPKNRRDPQTITEDIKGFGLPFNGVQVIDAADFGHAAESTFLASPGPGQHEPRTFGKRVVGSWVQRFNAHEGPIYLTASHSGNRVSLGTAAPRDGKCGLYLVSVLYESSPKKK